jgi:hypothetical protein
MKIKAEKGRFGLFGTLVAVTLVACGSDLSAGASASNTRRDSNAAVAIDLLRPPVNPDSLIITELVAANALSSKHHLINLSFLASNAADYAEVQYCSEEACEPLGNTVVNSIDLPILPEGRYTAKVRACMLPERVLEGQPNCGEWNLTEFSSPQSPDVATLAALDEKRAKESELFTLSQELIAVLEEFKQNSERCLTLKKSYDRIVAIRGLTATYLSLGEAFVELSLKRHAEKSSQDAKLAGATPVDRAVTPISEQEKRLAKFQRYNMAVQNFAKARGFFAEAKPIPAIQTLGLAMFDLFLASSENDANCLAESQAKIAMAAIKLRVDELNERIESLTAFLEEGSQP